ncbi:hypothetical protein AB9M75_11860 [Lactobacillus sp. AN1001]
MIIKGQVKEVMMRDMGVAGLHKDSEFIVTMEILGTETELQFPVERETVGNYDLDRVMDLDIDVQRVVRLDGPDRYKVSDEASDRIPFENIEDSSNSDENEEVETYDDEEAEMYDDEDTQEQQESSEEFEQTDEEQQQREQEENQPEHEVKRPDFLGEIVNKQSEKTEENRTQTEEKTIESDQANNKPAADSSVDEVVNDDTGEMTDEEIAQKMGRKEKTETQHVEVPKVTNPVDSVTETDYFNEGESISGGMVPVNRQEHKQNSTQGQAQQIQEQNSSETIRNDQDERSSQTQNNEDNISGANIGIQVGVMGGYDGSEDEDEEEDYPDGE